MSWRSWSALGFYWPRLSSRFAHEETRRAYSTLDGDPKKIPRHGWGIASEGVTLARVRGVIISGIALIALMVTGAARADVDWPDPLVLTLSGTTSASQWGEIAFEERDVALQMPGSRLELGRLRAAGAEVVFGYRGELLYAAGGMGYGTTRHEPGTELRVLGPTASIERVHLFRWFIEAGIARRFGDLTPMLMMHAAYSRALVDIAGAERLLFRGSQFAIGPKIAVRAHLYKSFYLQAGLFADAMSFPDHVVSLGMGVGQ